MDEDGLEDLLREQISYYRARAPEYEAGALDMAGGDEVIAALDRCAPSGEVLELACGPGVWTERLLRDATAVTAVDASPEMLAIAARRVGDDPRVRLIEADLFEWRPDRLYDFIFFGFWLSHVPVDRFESFWAMVGAALRPGGRVFFADDAYITPEEEPAEDGSIRRRLEDGTTFRAIKVPHTPGDLERRLTALGWDIAVHPSAGPFFWGLGGRA